MIDMHEHLFLFVAHSFSIGTLSTYRTTSKFLLAKGLENPSTCWIRVYILHYGQMQKKIAPEGIARSRIKHSIA